MIGFRHIVIIVAAGKGVRMHSQEKKQYLKLDKVPVLTRTIAVFDSHEKITDIILVLPKEDRAFCMDSLIKPYGIQTPIHLVNGGATRQESVFNGLEKACDLSQELNTSFVLIHDGVRPFVGAALIDDCIAKATMNGACIPVVKISDTVKKVVGTQISKTLDRELLFLAQTPQVFRLDLILKAYAHAREDSFSGTDDASIMEHAGLPVSITKGSLSNIKLTTPEDISLAGYFLSIL